MPSIRHPEPELMDLPQEAAAYAAANFADVDDAFVSRLLELSGNLSTATTLDLGTGPADIPIRLWKQRPTWRIVAMDASPAMLEIARSAVVAAQAQHTIHLVYSDAKAAPFPSNSFDLIFSNSILHHVSDPSQFWREIARLIRPGGLIFVRDLFRPDSETEINHLVQQHAGRESPLLREEFRRSLAAAYTTDEVTHQLIEAGLNNLKVAKVTDRHLDVWGQR
jgi:ubiquinone/menaquinone biosynthesis C-methylase UbiE